MDTPVVVIGSSLTFKQGSKGKTAWQEIAKGQTYQTIPVSTVSEIAIKTTATPDCDDDHRDDDGNEATDKQRVIVDPASPSFKIIVYTVASGAAVSITSDGKTISLENLIQGATMCPNSSKRRLDYSSDGNCTNSDQFAKVDIKIGTSVTTIDCILDPTSSYPRPCLGKCRIVLRCKDTSHKAR